MSLRSIIHPGMKGVFYGRHSTDKQNMDTQLRSAYDFAEKYECEIIDEYLDEGVSSRKKVRKGLEHLIRDANEKKFEFIVIYSHSRLARIPEEHDVLRLTMSVLGVHIVESSTETLYSYGDIVYSSIKDALAKYELDKIRVTTRDALKSLLQQGLWTGGKAPFGYKYHKKLRRTGKKDNQSTIDQISSEFSMDLATANSIQYGKFECIEDELVLVNKVFDLYKRGYGFRQIADMMPKASYRGKNWDKEKVKQIIINPFYAGYMAIRKRNSTSRNTINNRNEWEMQTSPHIQPVITYREWEECFHLYEQRKDKKFPPNYFKTSFLLSNLLICKACNQRLMGKDQRSKGYGKKIYICKSCDYKLGADDVHNAVWRLLVKLQSKNNEDIIKSIKEKIIQDCADLKEEKRILEKILERERIKLFAVNNKIDNLFRIHADNTVIKLLYIGKETLNNSIDQKTSQIQKLQESIYTLETLDANREYIEEKILDFKQLNTLPQIQLRRLYLYLIEYITVEMPGKLECKLRINLEKL